MDQIFRTGQGKERVGHVPAVVTSLLKFTPKVKWITLRLGENGHTCTERGVEKPAPSTKSAVSHHKTSAGGASGSHQESSQDGIIAGFVIGGIVCLLLLIAPVGYVIHRLYPNQFRSFRNIDNPIYKKNTVDGIKLKKSRSSAHAGWETTRVCSRSTATAARVLIQTPSYVIYALARAAKGIFSLFRPG